MPRVDAQIVLSGGRSTRFGSDKASALLDGQSLLHRTLSSLHADLPTFVVGDEHEGFNGVTWLREEPPFSGPVAALATAVHQLSSEVEWVSVLAVDMPYGAKALATLEEEASQDASALIPEDGEGFIQPLCALYNVKDLKSALATMQPVAGKSMRELTSLLTMKKVRMGEELMDIDSPEDIKKVSDE